MKPRHLFKPGALSSVCTHCQVERRTVLVLAARCAPPFFGHDVKRTTMRLYRRSRGVSWSTWLPGCSR